MKSTHVVEPRVRELLAEAAEWRLLGLLFERPRDGWWQDVESVCGETRGPEVAAAAASAARQEAAEGLYLALLGPGGIVPPREVSYRPMRDPGHLLADVKGFYEAFAFRPQTEEPPDHIAVEAGFVGYLCLKEAFALARGQDEEAEIAAQAARRFKQEHLSALAWPLARRMEKTGVRYLSLAARALALRTGPRPESEAAAENSLPLCASDCPLECEPD
jgi:nitrate reductase assembly molybdenum cofactor insertion protein NarJ